MLEYNDSRGCVLSLDRTTPGVSFCPGIERLHWSRSFPGQNDSPGGVLSQDRMNSMESFYPSTE